MAVDAQVPLHWRCVLPVIPVYADTISDLAVHDPEL